MFFMIINSTLELHESLRVGASPILDSWPLYGSPIPITLILVSYISFVLHFGPKWMKNREPFDLKYVIIAYNAIQVYHNYWMITTAMSQDNYFNFLFGFGCAKVTKAEDDVFRYKMYRAFWIVTLNKLLDLLDTVFFVLRKKQSHVTFLHVHHHAAMVAIIWTFGKYFPGLELMIVGFCNLIVHTFMYAYYLIAALGPKYRKYLWWKKQLTLMQIAQFLIIISYMTVSLWTSCGYNPIIVKCVIIETTINLMLFVNFYRKAYWGKTNAMQKIICGSLQYNHDVEDEKHIHKGQRTVSNGTSDINNNGDMLWANGVVKKIE